MKWTNVTSFNEFPEVWDLFLSSFDSDELRSKENYDSLFKNDNFSLIAFFDKGEFIGFFSLWLIDDLTFVEHLAVSEKLRGQGIGSELIESLKTSVDGPIILEVERPHSEANAERRIEFYKRKGFTLNEFDYIQPPYDDTKEPVPLYLMTYPDKLDYTTFLSVRKKIHQTVYGLDDPFVSKRECC